MNFPVNQSQRPVAGDASRSTLIDLVRRAGQGGARATFEIDAADADPARRAPVRDPALARRSNQPLNATGRGQIVNIVV